MDHSSLLLETNLDQYAIETFVNRNGQICLLGNDLNFLKDKAAIIRQYSQVTFPQTKLGDVCVQPFDSEKVLNDNNQIYEDELRRWLKYDSEECVAEGYEMSRSDVENRMLSRHEAYYSAANKILKKGYLYSLDLNLILASSVKTIIDISHRYTAWDGFTGVNCHAAAKIASGTFPSTNAPIIGTCKVSIDELSCGDIVRLSADHSIVFLDDDICLSANGIRSRLNICRIDEVLNLYYRNSSYKSRQDLLRYSAKFYRKNEEINYSDKLIDTIRENYLLKIDLNYYGEAYKAIAYSQEEIMKSLFIQCYLTDSIPSDISKKMHAELYSAQSGWMLNSALYDWIRNIIFAMDNFLITKEQAFVILENPRRMQNLALAVLDNGQNALIEQRITIDDIIHLDCSETLSEMISPPTLIQNIYRFFAAQSINKNVLAEESSCTIS